MIKLISFASSVLFIFTLCAMPIDKIIGSPDDYENENFTWLNPLSQKVIASFHKFHYINPLSIVKKMCSNGDQNNLYIALVLSYPQSEQQYLSFYRITHNRECVHLRTITIPREMKIVAMAISFDGGTTALALQKNNAPSTHVLLFDTHKLLHNETLESLDRKESFNISGSDHIFISLSQQAHFMILAKANYARGESAIIIRNLATSHEVPYPYNLSYFTCSFTIPQIITALACHIDDKSFIVAFFDPKKKQSELVRYYTQRSSIKDSEDRIGTYDGIINNIASWSPTTTAFIMRNAHHAPALCCVTPHDTQEYQLPHQTSSFIPNDQHLYNLTVPYSIMIW